MAHDTATNGNNGATSPGARPTRRRVRPLHYLLIGLLLALGIVGGLGMYRVERLQRARQALGEVQLAVEAYGARTGGYPATLAAALPDGLPTNPYTGAPLAVLEPGDAPVPGGVVYLPTGPMVGAALETAPRHEFDQYVLVMYGPGKHGYGRGPEGRLAGLGQDTLSGIAWDRVLSALTTGAEYIPPQHVN